jgi:hypothetical protein
MKQLLFALAILLSSQVAFAQSKANDIPVDQLPAEVKTVLEKYLNILRSSPELDLVAEQFLEIAGGSLVNEDGKTLRGSIKPYSLKKDFTGVNLYANPVVITRVNKTFSNGDGFGESALRGNVYKIWIAKKAGGAGMPAPISIIVPEGHPSIKTPKVVGIGSL